MLESQTENALATWTVAECPFTIEYSLRVIDDIRLGVVDAYFSLPRGGAEIGGILLGRNQGRLVTITDSVPLDCEHATGPSFVLSPNDHAKLADLLASAQGNPLGTQPVGWYHSHTRSEIHLSAADIDIHKRYFPESWQVALVLKPHYLQPTRAGFFFRETDGSIHATASYQEFVPEALAVQSQRDESAAAVPEPVLPYRPQPEPPVTAISMPAEPQRQAAAPDPSPRGRPRNWGRVLFVAVGWTCSIVLMFALGTLVNDRSFRERSASVLHAISNPSVVSPPASQFSSPPSLALHAKRQNGDLELDWSRESHLIATATSGVISIQDGGSKRQITLTSTQVHGGSLLYSPTSDQIEMQLTVTAPAGTVTESVMVILPKVGRPQIYPLPASKPSSASLPHSQAQLDSVPLATASKPFRQPPLAKSVPPPALPFPADSPPLKLNLDPAVAVVPSLVSQTLVPPPPTPVTLSQPPVQPPAAQPPAVQPPASIVIRYQPAVPIAKTAPVFPPELQTLALARKVVEVKVAIDKNGQVTKAEAIPQKNVSQFLIGSAVNAARLWKFQPARRNDEPVPSETLLQFVFGH